MILFIMHKINNIKIGDATVKHNAQVDVEDITLKFKNLYDNNLSLAKFNV